MKETTPKSPSHTLLHRGLAFLETFMCGLRPYLHSESRLLIHLLNSTAHLKVKPRANKSRFGNVCSNCKRSLQIIKSEATLLYKAKEGKKAEKLVGVGARENMWDTLKDLTAGRKSVILVPKNFEVRPTNLGMSL